MQELQLTFARVTRVWAPNFIVPLALGLVINTALSGLYMLAGDVAMVKRAVQVTSYIVSVVLIVVAIRVILTWRYKGFRVALIARTDNAALSVLTPTWRHYLALAGFFVIVAIVIGFGLSFAIVSWIIGFGMRAPESTAGTYALGGVVAAAITWVSVYWMLKWPFQSFRVGLIATPDAGTESAP